MILWIRGNSHNNFNVLLSCYLNVSIKYSKKIPSQFKIKFINFRYFFKIYIQLNFLGTVVDIAQREKMHPICWENHGKNDNLPIHFDSGPYIFLGNRDYQCHQGRDCNITSSTAAIN